MQTITLPLSRWHHVGQRLRNLAQKLADEAYSALAETRVSSVIDEEQAQAMRARGQKALEKAQDIMVVHQGLATIRGELAEANTKLGVSAKLAVLEAKRQEKSQLQRLASVKLLTMPSVDNANVALEKRNKNETTVRYMRGDENEGLALRVVGIDALDGLKERVRALELDIQDLTDEISDINRNTVSISLDDNVVELANLNA